MGKMKRFLCCLILPVMTMLCLAGCGKDKTPADINNKMSAIRAVYKIESNDPFANELFSEDGLVSITYTANEMKKIYNTVTEFNESKFAQDMNLYNRYRALINVQHKVVKNTLLYYVYMNEEFYEKMELAGVRKDEVNQIYKNLKDLEDSFKTFKVAKDKLEQTVDILTFHGVVRADLTSYAYSLNLLIEDCIKFTDYFIDLNEKYFFSNEITVSNRESYIKHYLYEGCHELNELVYYRYLKAFNNVNECDLSKLVESSVFGSDQVIEGLYEGITVTAGSVYDGSKTISDALTVDDLETFKEVRDGFIQKFGIYKTVYNKMDYYKYNSYVVEGTVNSYVNSCGSIEKANISLIEKFYGDPLDSYCREAFWSKI